MHRIELRQQMREAIRLAPITPLQRLILRAKAFGCNAKEFEQDVVDTLADHGTVLTLNESGEYTVPGDGTLIKILIDLIISLFENK